MVHIIEEEPQLFEMEHVEAIRKTAPECTLFLKRDFSFPLKSPCKIAAYGRGVRKTIKGGTGSGDVNVRHFVTIEEGLKKAGFEITSGEWLDNYDKLIENAHKEFVEQIRNDAKKMGINPVMYGMGKDMPEPEYEFPMELTGAAAIYVIARNSGEGSDRTDVAGDIRLTAAEIRDINFLNRNYEKFMLVLNTGGMIDLNPVKDVKNIFLLGQLGTPTGDVLADILLGKSFPSGKLAMTWAALEQYPSTTGFGDPDDTYYREGIYVGYRYFDSAGVTPNYPFGYGESFTNFTVRPKGLQVNDCEITIIADVENIGNYRGKEVVQVYFSAPARRMDKPYQELAAYTKTSELNPGEKEEVILKFDAKEMASYDVASAAYVLEKGQYTIHVGNSSRNTCRAGSLFLSKDVITVQLKNICPKWDFDDLKFRTEEKAAEGQMVCLEPKSFATNEIFYRDYDMPVQKGKGCTWKNVIEGKGTITEFVSGLSKEELAYLVVGLFDENPGMESMIGASAHSIAGAAGETTDRLEKYGIPTIVMADGPAGLRLCTQYKNVEGRAKGLDNPLANMMEFLEPEQLEQLSKMVLEPTEEEKSALINYVYCTAIPVGTSLAQSWSQEVCDICGDIVGKEMEMFGVNLWLAPAMNIQRSPLCGRNFEYYSEDPLLSGNIAAAVTNGVQRHPGCAVTIKHFAANNQETNRQGSNSIVSERALREIYLKPFEICIRKSAPEAVMSSYNLINGEHTCNSRDLLSYVLRDEWGYEGIVMTDWYAADDVMVRTNVRPNKHKGGSASGCIYAGNDLIMPGIKDEYEDILRAYENKTAPYPVSLFQLQTCGKRILETIKKLKY